MTNNDEPSNAPSDMNENLTVVSVTRTSNTNGSTTNWFRSIPRRIRKFISKQSRHKHLEQASNDFTKSNISNSIDTTNTNDGLDETNLYSIVDQMGNGNDEEVAMIRATAQMAR